jgi:hypothetical protein
VSLSDIVNRYNNESTRFYIKVDVQGFEPNVIDIHFLSTLSSPWLVKTEYAPKWIEEAGLDPVVFLAELCDNFFVCQNPAAYGYRDHFISLLTNSRIIADDAYSFVDFISSHNRDHRGWCDLLIAPKTFGNTYDFSHFCGFDSNG